METKTIIVSNTGDGMNEALDLTEEFSRSLGLDTKKSSRMRLLTEETLSMVRAITGDFRASFLLEENDGTGILHLKAKSELDYTKRQEFLSVSTRGKNIASTGIMEKLRGMIEACIYSFGDVADYTGMMTYGGIGPADIGMSQAMYSWSMQKYRNEINATKDENPEAWDELEKSIIANIADDVKVGVTREGVILEVMMKLR